MTCPNHRGWEKDDVGYYVWSAATNGTKCYIHEYIKELEAKIEESQEKLQKAKIEEFKLLADKEES